MIKRFKIFGKEESKFEYGKIKGNGVAKGKGRMKRREWK